MRPTRWILVLILTSFPLALADEADRSSMKPLREKEWDREKASHLLRRAGFGGTPAELDKLTELGPAAAVDYLVAYRKIPYRIAPPPVDSLLLEPLDRRRLRDLSQDERRAVQQKRRRAERRTFEETRLWWMDRLFNSPRPFEEKMTLFWHGRFTSGMREVRRAIFMKEQNEFFRRNALGNYRDIVLGISKDRAMLVYLDGVRSNRRKPNENYARELMELFTLGVGHYTEKDIKAAARAFTGWGFDRDGFVFRRRRHDDGKKTFLGRTGNWGGEDIVDIILAQPECSRYLSRKLLEFFVHPEPGRRLIARFAAVIRKNKYELKPSMRTLFQSRAFYHAENRGCLVKSPVEVVVGTARQLGQQVGDLRGAMRAMISMGQEIMQPPNVKGWDGGAKWINPATLFNRYNVVAAMLERRGRAKNRFLDEPSMTENGSAESMNMMAPKMSAKSRVEPGPHPAYDPLPTMRANRLETAEQIVDFYVAHLLAAPLSLEKRQALVEFLQGESGSFSAAGRGAATAVRTMIKLLCGTPEYQMT